MKAGEPSPLERISKEITPAAGTQTDYDIPLSLQSFPLFIGWKDAIVLAEGEEIAFHDALVQVVAPCCDDNTAFQCCCEKGGARCNLVTSGKGLAVHLIREEGYTVDQVRDAVLQWFRFARPDYFVAAALEKEGTDPGLYGLTTQGDCYRGMCEVPISQGGAVGWANWSSRRSGEAKANFGSLDHGDGAEGRFRVPRLSFQRPSPTG